MPPGFLNGQGFWWSGCCGNCCGCFCTCSHNDAGIGDAGFLAIAIAIAIAMGAKTVAVGVVRLHGGTCLETDYWRISSSSSIHQYWRGRW